MLRLAQLALSWLCNWLVGRYALRVAATLGSAMPSFFLATAGGALGCSLLLAVALLSTKSVALLRASLFEIAFHATAVGLYASQSSYLHVATSIYLEPYKNDLEAYTYPAIVTSYWLGYFLAALHSLDTVYALKHYGRSRR
ncbi:protein singles bar [Thrips palmi]|uniref:Protein singles bar n=1 Tax=Thrips palmi TaxID=161013 RepID=A0A6P8Z387_THRPL|nr:protein singles bar [Thrips palmi]